MKGNCRLGRGDYSDTATPVTEDLLCLNVSSLYPEYANEKCWTYLIYSTISKSL